MWTCADKRYIVSLPKKRTRSASSASDHPVTSTAARDDELPVNDGLKSHSASVPVSKGNPGRKQRGGRKPAAAQDLVISVEGDEGVLIRNARL